MNNLVYAWRYLIKKRGGLFTRIISLSLGMLWSVLLLSYVDFSLTYDRFYPDADRIYQMWMNTPLGRTNKLLSPVADALVKEIPQVEAATRAVGTLRSEFSYEEESFPLEYMAVDTMFFDVLDFGMISGNPKEIFLNKNNIILSEETAKSFFGVENPVGKIIRESNKTDFIVCGVFTEIPHNNHIGTLNALCSISSVEGRYNLNWNGDKSFRTYLKLRNGSKIQDVESQFDDLLYRHGISENELNEAGESYLFYPITKSRVLTNPKVKSYAYLFSFLAILVLAVACLNYMLVSVSALVNRSKSIAMMRCSGAQRWDVFKMFFSETALIAFISFVVDVCLIVCLQEQIRDLTGYAIAGLFTPSRIYVWVVVFFVTFFLAGIIPASLFASVPLTTAFKGVSSSKNGWKRSLLFAELVGVTFVITFLIVSIFQYNQLSKGDMGYKYDKLAYVNIMGSYQSLQVCEQELASLLDVESVGTAYSLPIHGYSSKAAYDEVSGDKLFDCGIDYVTPNYFSTMGVQIVEGQNISYNGSTNDVIVNEEYVRLRGWTDSPIGRQISDGGTSIHTIVGVANDFRVKSSGELQPIVFHNISERMDDADGKQYSGMRTMVRFNTLTPEAMEAVSDKLREFNTIDNWRVNLYEEQVKKIFRGESSFRNVLIVTSIVVFIIALIGLIGYVGDEIQRRVKEIGVRRVNGATGKDIIILLMNNVSKISLPAIVIGLIACYFISNIWVQGFNNHVDLHWWMYASGGLLILSFVYITQIVKTFDVANRNPVSLLRNTSN